MNVREIIIKYLTENGFDGLCCEDCGCSKDQIVLCEQFCMDCQPAYKHDHPDCEACDNNCDAAPDGPCFSTEKPI
jgi:hypothetical protein